MSSSMRVMMQMMEAQGQIPGNQGDMNKMAKDNTLELNAGHPIVVNLNQLRKTNKEMAGLVARQLLDNVMVSSGIPFNLNEGTDRQYKLISSYLELMVEREPAQASRKEIPMPEEPILKKAQDMRSSSSDKKQVVYEKTIDASDKQ